MPSAITPGTRVSMATKVSQITAVSALWCAATLAAMTVFESAV